MIENLQSWDLAILRAINTPLNHPFTDGLMRLWSAEWPWFLLASFFLVQAFVRKAFDFLKALLWIGATIGLADILAAQIIKPWLGRIRPCKVDELVRIVDRCGGMLSFPSNHATNAAAFAVFWFFLMGPKQGALAVACGCMVGFSRVYLGVHYPSDILGGFAFGSMMGVLSTAIFRQTALGKRCAWA